MPRYRNEDKLISPGRARQGRRAKTTKQKDGDDKKKPTNDQDDNDENLSQEKEDVELSTEMKYNDDNQGDEKMPVDDQNDNKDDDEKMSQEKEDVEMSEQTKDNNNDDDDAKTIGSSSSDSSSDDDESSSDSEDSSSNDDDSSSSSDDDSDHVKAKENLKGSSKDDTDEVRKDQTPGDDDDAKVSKSNASNAIPHKKDDADSDSSTGNKDSNEEKETGVDNDNNSVESDQETTQLTDETGRKLSSYEMKRLERIKRNEERLAQLGLDKSESPGRLSPSPQRKPRPRNRQKYDNLPKRQSIARESKNKAVNYSDPGQDMILFPTKEGVPIRLPTTDTKTNQESTSNATPDEVSVSNDTTPQRATKEKDKTQATASKSPGSFDFLSQAPGVPATYYAERQYLRVVANMFRQHARLYFQQATFLDQVAMDPDPAALFDSGKSYRLFQEASSSEGKQGDIFIGDSLETKQDRVRRQNVCKIAKDAYGIMMNYQNQMDSLLSQNAKKTEDPVQTSLDEENAKRGMTSTASNCKRGAAELSSVDIDKGQARRKRLRSEITGVTSPQSILRNSKQNDGIDRRNDVHDEQSNDKQSTSESSSSDDSSDSASTPSSTRSRNRIGKGSESENLADEKNQNADACQSDIDIDEERDEEDEDILGLHIQSDEMNDTEDDSN